MMHHGIRIALFVMFFVGELVHAWLQASGTIQSPDNGIKGYSTFLILFQYLRFMLRVSNTRRTRTFHTKEETPWEPIQTRFSQLTEKHLRQYPEHHNHPNLAASRERK